MSNKIWNRPTSILFALAALVLIAASPAHALIDVNTCGQNLSTPGGQYVLTTDLDCSGTNANGIDITASNVVFHLAGHTIASTDCDVNQNISGIFVQGGLTGVKIDGGTVRGFNDGIVLSSSTSRVYGMTVTNACVFGIVVEGNNSQVDTSHVTLSGFDGIGIEVGSGNHIKFNDISDNTRVGVEISSFSDNNVVENNIINRNGLAAGAQGGVAIFNGSGNVVQNNSLNNNFNGIEIQSPGNTVLKNTVNGSVSTGIFITSIGSPSIVKLNTALGNAFVDMSDDSPTCQGNLWRKNIFQTDLAGGMPNGGPGDPCIK